MTETKPDCTVTLVTPMYNEGEKIQDNLPRILAAMDELDVSWEYILIDDGSKDDTYEKAREIVGDHPSCHLIHYEVNRGRGYALRQGFAVARGRYVIATESDLSWGPGIIGRLYGALLETGADVVIASVHLPGGGMENVPMSRMALTRVGNKIVRWAFGGELTMLTGMTRGYRREVLERLHLEEDRKEIHLEIIAKAQAVGFRVVEIPATIRWDPPAEGQKGRGGRGIYRFILSHLTLSFQHASVKMLSIMAAVTGLLGIAVTAIGTVHKLFRIFPHPLPYLVTYGLILCVMGMLFMLFALVSIQLKYVYRSVVHLQSQLRHLESTVGRASKKEGDDVGSAS
jgi:dolichol-phosphate mannosyltransferase